MVIWNLMVRFKYIIALVVVALMFAAYIMLRPSTSQQRQGVIELTNLPDQYCPLQAQVAIFEPNTKTSEKALFDKQLVVDECRYVVLKEILELASEPRQLFVKLPNALAFRLQIDSVKGRYQYAPSLGDVNGDNVIDSIDETLVANALFGIDPIQITANDIDRDKKVSVLDLSLTRVNYRAGAVRPDGKNWSKL
ncbi:MAG: dockerin type I domain-containing protein [Candidatus Berkelbacteria bacterium]|nr:dockerin type I domain-containing protein [Candidatus Berkelbacteria bacterium]MCR4307275.1 dockerin type I domain-containing protein [Candidatus Berkelbacteria bacterium]